MSFLPLIDHAVDLTVEDGIMDVYELSELSALEDAVTDLLQLDCQAVVMDDEVVFDRYQEELSHRERILEYMLLEQLIENTHRHLFAPLLRQNTSFTIEIYIFVQIPMKIVIIFDNQNESFTVLKKVKKV